MAALSDTTCRDENVVMTSLLLLLIMIRIVLKLTYLIGPERILF